MYEIRVAGVVSESDLRDMQAVTVAPDQVSTILYGLADQAALYGLLARLRTLGLDVIEVRRVSSPSDSGSDPSPTQTDDDDEDVED